MSEQQLDIQSSKKYRQVIEFFRTAIAEGRYQDGERLPSESEQVRQFGLSRPTISRAMRELQSIGLIDRRAGSGSFARVMQKPDRHEQLKFGLLIPGLGDTEIFESICGQIAREAQSRGHALLWADLSSKEPNKIAAEKACEQYLRQQVAGVFFAPLELSPRMEEVNRQIPAMLDQAGIPVVLLDRDFELFPARSKFDLVGIDNCGAGYALAQHLIATGSQSITFLARPHSASTVQARAAGVLSAWLDARRSFDAYRFHLADAGDLDQVRAMLASARADTIVCANDKTAALLMQSLHELGISVPSEMKVVGFDDVRYAKLLRPTLTTIHQPCQEIGTVALHLMLERVANPTLPARHVMLNSQLVLRQSAPAAIASGSVLAI